ncbi:TatD-related DNase [Trachipleistophora hominis]|uniref:TatD-related DNase n=1 Tax=Trachipleistophora hominis TaxID=72359 RepID=L7JZY1_TRAHO|nr:TatD-related DNase [Trachipleistophora hominis]
MFIDIAFNITHYKDKEHDDTIQHCIQNNTMPIFVGTNVDTSKECLRLAKKYHTMCYSGIHPTESGRCSGTNELPVDDCSILALGECGLDYDRLEYASKNDQQVVFKNMLAFSYTNYFFHSRNAHNDFLSIVKQRKSGVNGIVHSFTGTKDELVQLLDHNLYIGINGCSLKNKTDIFEVLPLNRLLLETDAPFCCVRKSYYYWNDSVPKIRKYRAGDVKIIYDLVSGIYGIGRDEMEKIVEDNLVRIYGNRAREGIQKWKTYMKKTINGDDM